MHCLVKHTSKELRRINKSTSESLLGPSPTRHPTMLHFCPDREGKMLSILSYMCGPSGTLIPSHMWGGYEAVRTCPDSLTHRTRPTLDHFFLFFFPFFSLSLSIPTNQMQVTRQFSGTWLRASTNRGSKLTRPEMLLTYKRQNTLQVHFVMVYVYCTSPHSISSDFWLRWLVHKA